MKQIRVGVVGVGYLGKFHAEKYSHMNAVELVGVVDIDSSKAQKIAKQVNTNAFTHYDQLFGKVDAVSIAVPTPVHYAVGKAFLNRDVDVLIEKPMTTSIEEADELIETAEAGGLILQVGHLERFNPAAVALQDIVKRPLFIEAHRLSVFKDRSTDVSVVLDLMGQAEIKSIHAAGAPVICEHVDIANVRLEFDNGCVANVTASRISAKNERKIRIFQKDAYISVDFANHDITVGYQTAVVFQGGRTGTGADCFHYGRIRSPGSPGIRTSGAQGTYDRTGNHGTDRTAAKIYSNIKKPDPLGPDFCLMKVPMICNSPQPTVVIIAGETSGDLHGARLVNAMLARNQGISFYGVGGPALRQAGVRLSVDAAQLSVVGLTEVFSKLPAILKGLKTVKLLVNRLKPDLLILIDFPDFNLKIAAAAKKLGIPVLYYISPQIWAWRPGRVKQIAKLVDHMAVILPFEEDFYKKHQVPVTFVGHPLLDDHLPERSEACQQRNAAQPIIGLLPGSRESEILRHVPVMLETAKILQTMLKNVQFFISHAPSVERKHLEKLVQDHVCNVDLEIISDPVQDVFKRCSLVVAASGTVTLQALHSRLRFMGFPWLLFIRCHH
jgi:lipid-A-disaccharide synthase